MKWADAHEKIKNSIKPGIHLSDNFTVKKVLYNGFLIQIDGRLNLELRWSTLEHCWKAMNEKHVFNQNIFIELFGEGCLGNRNFVDVVGQVFMNAGLARFHENVYHNFNGRLFHQIKMTFDSHILSHTQT